MYSTTDVRKFILIGPEKTPKLSTKLLNNIVL